MKIGGSCCEDSETNTITAAMSMPCRCRRMENQSFAEVVIPRVDVDEDCEEEYCISVEEEDAPDGIFNKKRPACLSKSF